MTDLRTVAQQALEALYQAKEFTELYDTEHAAAVNERCHENITALRAALAQQAEPAEPVGTFLVTGNEFCGAPPAPYATWGDALASMFAAGTIQGLRISALAQQGDPVEPVAWVGDPSTQDYASTVPDPQVADRLARHGIPMPEGYPK